MISDASEPLSLAIIALGSNLDAPCQQLRRAMAHLRRHSEGQYLESNIYRTSPEAMPEGSPDFANAIVAIETRQTAFELLAFLQSLEVFFGRPSEHKKNTSRVLDLDLITLGRQVIQSDRLILPHPRAQSRRFVLQPLVDILPDFIFPGSETHASQGLDDLADSNVVIWDQ